MALTDDQVLLLAASPKGREVPSLQQAAEFILAKRAEEAAQKDVASD